MSRNDNFNRNLNLLFIILIFLIIYSKTTIPSSYSNIIFMSSYILSYFESLSMSIPTLNDLPKFDIPSHYDYNKSTEENYAMKDISFCSEEEEGKIETTENVRRSVRLCHYFVGKYALERKQMDYTYHKIYIPERQEYQDKLVDRFLDTLILDVDHGRICDVPEENWIVFTAGPMGAGKSFVMEWLHSNGLFPLKAFVKVDPDMMRNLLPEIHKYTKLNPDSAGKFTQKEVGYVSELLTTFALKQGKNVLVDGSLRDSKWYSQYIRILRQLYPEVKVAIIHITAHESTVLERAQKRALETGRHVPIDVIKETYRQINHSMEVLTPLTNFVASFENEKNAAEPRLLYQSSRENVRCCETRTDRDGGDDGGDNNNDNDDNNPSSYGEILEYAEHTCMLPDENWKQTFKDVWKMTCKTFP